jgi:hypothetical protein
VRSDWKSGRVEVRWRPGSPFDLARLKKDLFTWRGGVRYGGAQIVATGRVEAREEARWLLVGGEADGPLPPGGTRRFALRPARGADLPPPGARVRVAGEADLSGSGAEVRLTLTVREYEILPDSSP